MRLTVLSICLSLILLAGCSPDKVRPTEESERAKEAFSVLDDIRSAYSKKFFDELRSLASDTGRVTLNERLKDFESVTIETYPVWVAIKPDESVVLRFGWEGSWVYAQDGLTRTLSRQGTGDITLSGKPLRLSEIGRDTFLYEPSEARPLSPAK